MCAKSENLVGFHLRFFVGQSEQDLQLRNAIMLAASMYRSTVKHERSTVKLDLATTSIIMLTIIFFNTTVVVFDRFDCTRFQLY